MDRQAVLEMGLLAITPTLCSRVTGSTSSMLAWSQMLIEISMTLTSASVAAKADEHVFVATVTYRGAERFLGAAIDCRGVDDIDAAVQQPVHNEPNTLLVGFEKADRARSKTESGD